MEDKIKVLIEAMLFNVQAYMEEQFYVEGLVDESKRDSKKMIFYDGGREEAKRKIDKELEEFSKQQKCSIDEVRKYLVEVVERWFEDENPDIVEYYQELKKTILWQGTKKLEDDDFER